MCGKIQEGYLIFKPETATLAIKVNNDVHFPLDSQMSWASLAVLKHLDSNLICSREQPSAVHVWYKF